MLWIIILIANIYAETPDFYYQEFSKKYPHDKNIEFVLTTSDAIVDLANKGGWKLSRGVAYQLKDKIYINEYLWELLTPRCQRHIVYHELGHAVMDMTHSYTKKGGLWNYIMYPEIDLANCYRR
jgi:hypothetical protein